MLDSGTAGRREAVLPTETLSYCSVRTRRNSSMATICVGMRTARGRKKPLPEPMLTRTYPGSASPSTSASNAIPILILRASRTS